jgi:hypothetical protein
MESQRNSSEREYYRMKTNPSSQLALYFRLLNSELSIPVQRILVRSYSQRRTPRQLSRSTCDLIAKFHDRPDGSPCNISRRVVCEMIARQLHRLN